MLSIIDIVVFVGFIALVMVVGLWKSRSAKSEEGGAADYFLAGRGLKWWLIGISLIAANISAEQFVGMSGRAADTVGMAIASYEWMAAIALVVTAFVFLPYFLRTGIYTIHGFLEHRYNRAARSIMALFSMVLLIGVSLTGVIYAGALLMQELTLGMELNVPLTAWCWIMGGLAAAYVAAGGL
ncbi:MAG: sodium:proton symporter, partial [Kiritimatiellaeota bacterium]|nr:sodium:proton symporter [Kiritimatiellota bacterium]